MSLVGTRPILQDELLKYELHHRARIAIKPGITGMWQVSGRSDITDFEEVVRLDGHLSSLLLPLDEHSKTVTRVTVIGSPGGAEITHGFDWEGTSIRPGDRCRLHIACRIKVGGYLYIDSFFCHKQSPPCLIVAFRAILHRILQKVALELRHSRKLVPFCGKNVQFKINKVFFDSSHLCDLLKGGESCMRVLKVLQKLVVFQGTVCL